MAKNLIIVFVTVVINCEFYFTHQQIHNHAPALYEDGKKQYEVVLQQVKLPNFGRCWQNAVTVIEASCNALTEYSQSLMALTLADCFLEMSGEPSYRCASYNQLEERKQCIAAMPDRAFHVYSEFFTHCQNMCYFLRSMAWQEETETTFNRMLGTSKKIEKQLDLVQDTHQSLLIVQQQSLKLQETMLDQSVVLLESHSSVFTSMEELKNRTREQLGLLGDLSKQLSNLQSWALSEVTGFSSYICYGLALFLTILLTSMDQTRRARFWIVAILGLSFALETCLPNTINLIHQLPRSAQLEQELLQLWIWRFRYIVITGCSLIIFYTGVTHQEYGAANYRHLQRLMELVRTLSLDMQTLVRPLPEINGSSAVVVCVSEDVSTMDVAPRDVSEQNSPGTHLAASVVEHHEHHETRVSQTVAATPAALSRSSMLATPSTALSPNIPPAALSRSSMFATPLAARSPNIRPAALSRSSTLATPSTALSPNLPPAKPRVLSSKPTSRSSTPAPNTFYATHNKSATFKATPTSPATPSRYNLRSRSGPTP